MSAGTTAKGQDIPSGNMRIPGTEHSEMEILMPGYFGKHETITSTEGSFTILSKEPKEDYFSYRLRKVLDGEELQVAMDHYKLLCKNNLLWN